MNLFANLPPRKIANEVSQADNDAHVTKRNLKNSPLSTSPTKKNKVTLDDFIDRPENCKGPLMTQNQTRLDSMYWIKKPVSDTRWKIMAVPIVKKGLNADGCEPYPLYVEDADWIGVPRFFGLQTYGKPTIDNRTLGSPMNPDIHFTWKIQNTSQKPQKDAIDAWLKNDGEGILCLPCGAGKTVIAVYLALLMHRRTLILVQNGGLLSQWVERIQAICPDAKIGIIQQQKCEIDGMDFVIGMIQTVRESKADFSSIGMVIPDECHHIAARTFAQSIMKTWARYTVALSATPERRDGLTNVLHWLLGPLVFKCERKDITPQQITQIVYAEGNQKVTVYKGGVKGVPSMVTRMTKDAKRNQLVDYCIRKLQRTPGITKILVISDRCDHLTSMHEKFQDSGLYIGKVKKRDQEEAKQKSLIFASYSMAKEFLDIDGLNGMVLASPCIVDAEQVIGRLRENLKSAFWFETMENDAEFEEEFDHALFSVNLTDDISAIIKSFVKKNICRTRIVYDIVDPFDLFDGLAWKRHKLYKRLGYDVRRVSTDEFFE